MKLSILTTLLAVGLLAFTVNAEIDNDSILIDIESGESSVVLGTTEGPETTEAPETTDVPETTEAPESTQVPDSNGSDPVVHDLHVIDTEEVNKFVKELMETVGQIMVSVIESVNEGKPIDIHSHSISEGKHHHRHTHTHQQEDSGDIEHVPIQPRTFKTLWWLLKSILKTLRGINCTIKAVVNVKQSTEQMLTNFHVCGVETTKQIQAVLDSAQKVITIANDIISINDSVCENPDYLSDSVNASAKVSSKCRKQLHKKVISLNSQISNTNKLIRKVPRDAGDCVTNTFSDYVESIVDFPNFVKSCAKL